MLPDGIPEYKRRALRLALGVLLPCLVGYGVIGPEHIKESEDAQVLAKWAAITAAIVAQPLIGKAAQVGADRVLGTVLGGASGVVVHWVGARLLFGEFGDGAWLACAAAALAGGSVLVGTRYRLETSARLFVITLLLVTFAGDAGDATWRIALVRVAGIVSGVLLMVCLSVLLLPKSATVEVLHCFDRALKSLEELFVLAWQDYLPDLPEPQAAAGAPAPAPSAPLLADEAALSGVYAPVEDAQERGEAALSGVYSALFALADNAAAARSERLVGRLCGRLVLVPGPVFGALGRRPQVGHLPWEGLAGAADAARRVSRALLTLSQALEEGAADEARGAAPEAERLLREMARAGRGALGDVRDAFPLRRALPAGNALAFLALVEEWEGAAGGAARDALRGTRRHQRARAEWEQLAAALRARARGGRGRAAAAIGRPLAAPAPGGGKEPQASGRASPAASSAEDAPSVEITQRSVRPEDGNGTTSGTTSGAHHADGADGGGGGGAGPPPPPPGAITEWESLSFMLQHLGLELGALHQRVFAVLQQLP
jgi:hypothetical protein